jgi:pyrroloquinoline quinone (PQQ) biosynthesis protein C
MDILKSSQAVAESIVATQERSTKFSQSFFTEGVEMLKSQAESSLALVQELQQKAQEQQEAFQQLAQASTETYLDFLRDPLSAYQRVLDATEAAVRQGPDVGQKKRKSSSQ